MARLGKLGKDKTESKKDYNNKIEQEEMDQLRNTKPHGQFERDTDKKKSGKSWHWLRNGNLKRETENLLSVAQEQALNTYSVGKNYHKDVSNKCRLCGTYVENVVSTERVQEKTRQGIREHPLGLMQEVLTKSMWKVVRIKV